MQLLKITTVPIKYKEQENLPAEGDSAFSLEMAERNSSNVKIPVANTTNSQNNPELYDDNITGSTVQGLQRKSDCMVRESASEVEGNGYTVNHNYGRKNVQTQQRSNVSAYMRNNIQSAVTIDSALDNIDSVVPDKSWEPEVKAHHDKILKPESHKTVEEFAHVEIEYLGGFNYVPKSSAPDYEEPEE